ncbi:carboxypeptidase-like regulatory domain-containing protein [Croceitalea sp. MTPC9]|uniref:TonB-dependent receptor n=1 Tax=unclassified Croceitalea TaxID=2632280 RepID=UPI002B3804E8|nr:carboxypeptidase-like regulatory domain-containing protein [Croceitalea sp. MTPC6]GMN16726.1 carboxypeptidase-like regulatory domain-containing protein [Croceitalea sp. MTPC9]
MKLFRILFLTFIFSFYAKAQVSTATISISFEDLSRVNVLERLENLTEYEFYYIAEWFDDKLISGEYKDVKLDLLLKDIFEGTNINYFLIDTNRVILTKNNSIYNELPEGFFGRKRKMVSTDKEIRKETPPVFYDDLISVGRKKIETHRIGKENKNKIQRNYKLSGFVTRVDTGEPIPNLALVVKNQNRGTVTNEEGFYEIELFAGASILQVKALGIENMEKRVIMYNNGVLNMELEESLEQLDGVTVTAEVNKNVKDTSTGTEEIDIEESKNIPLVLGERDVLKVATALPGISTAGEGATGFNVRGGNVDQNLILFDDAVIYNPQHFFGIFSALNPFAIGALNIYKGNIPSEYGGRLSSVFDIKTKNGNTENFAGEASIGPVTGNLLLEIPVLKEKSSLLIGGRGAYADWILRSLDEESLNNSQASFYDVMASYRHNIDEKNDIKATAYYSRDDFSISSDSLYIYANRLFSFSWDHQFSKKSRANLVLSNSEYKFDIEFDSDSDDDFNLDYSIMETTAKLKMNYQYNTKLKLNYGLESKLYNVSPGSISPLGSGSIVEPFDIDSEKALESGIFLSGNYDVTEKLSLDAGIRYSFFAALGEASQRVFTEGSPRNEGTVIDTLTYEKNEVIKTYGGPEFRLGARYLLTPDFSVKVSYNNMIQYIHRLTNNTTVSPIDTWKLSDLNIRPQRGNQFSLGFYKNFDGDTYELSLEGYYKRSDDILDFKTGAQLLLNENIETEVIQGDGKSYGAEFLIRKNNGKLNGWLGYTYSRSFIRFDSPFSEERINNGEFFPSNFDRPHDISLVANYKLTRRFSLSTNFVYQTGRPVTIPVGSFNFNGAQFSVFSDRNSFRIPDFYRLDLGLNVEGNHKIKKFAHSFWTFSVYNVLGRNNPFSVFFVTNNGQVKAVKSSIFSIPVPAITYNFRF